MNYFDRSIESFDNKFVKEDSEILQNIFGTDDLLPLWIADMDFPIAKEITEEIKRLTKRGIYAYESATNDIYNSIIEWNKKRHNLSLEQESFIQVPSVLAGLALLIQELTMPDDGILIQAPVFHQFAQIIKDNHRKVVNAPLEIVDGIYEINFLSLEQKVQSKNVKIILLCNPHNPIGRVWKKSELQKIMDIADKYNVTIVSDEIHSDIVYPNHTFTSILALNSKKHIALLGSPAKTFGMHSISQGYICIPNETINKKIKKKVASMHLGDSNAFATFATIAAYTKGELWLNNLLIYLEKTIVWVQNFIQKELPLIKIYPTEGTYQIWLDFREMDLSDKELNSFLIEQAKLGLALGVWFDPQSTQFMRMNIASPLSKIQVALKQLKAAYDTVLSQ